MKRYVILVKGENYLWSIDALLSSQQAQDMENDNVNVELLVNSGPAWLKNYPLLLNVWCFVQDIFHFNWRRK